MILNAVIGAISTLVLFFLQAKLPMAGLDQAFLGPALFVMGLGAALGTKEDLGKKYDYLQGSKVVENTIYGIPSSAYVNGLIYK